MALILKLDENVTDTDLNKLGELMLDVNIEHNFTLDFLVHTSTTAYDARIIGEGNFFTDGTYSVPAGKAVTVTNPSRQLFLSSGQYKLGIAPKYGVQSLGVDFPNLTDLDAITLDCSQLAYSEYTFSALVQHWKLKNFSGDNMKNCVIISANGTNGLDVDVAEFKKITSSLSSVNISNTGAYGDAVDAFGNKVNLDRLILGSMSGTTGTYTQICDALFANGKTSGNLLISTPDSGGAKTVCFTISGWSVVGP